MRAAPAETFYDGNAVEPRSDGQTPCLDQLLSGYTGFCGSPYRSCRTDADLANLYAAVFTEVLADSSLFTLHRHALIRGNQKGVGKDKLCEILGAIRDGETPVDLNHYDENRINQGFGNGVNRGRRIFQVTNIVGERPYRNTMLTRWLTSESLTGPKHGGGDWLINPNTASVIFTLNEGSIDHDLLDRLLPINLVVEGDARKRTFAFDPVVFIHEHRTHIIEEVFGLALVCLRENREWQIPRNMDRRFDRWMKLIGAMLEVRGLQGFMENLDEVQDEVDGECEEFTELARRVFTAEGEKWLRPNEIAEYCRAGKGGDQPLYEKILGATKQPARHVSTYVLTPNVGRRVVLPKADDAEPIIVTLDAKVDAKSKSRCYRFTVPQTGGSGLDTPLEGPPGDPQCTSTESVGGGGGGQNGTPATTPAMLTADGTSTYSDGGGGGGQPRRFTVEKISDGLGEAGASFCPQSYTDPPNTPATPATISNALYSKDLRGGGQGGGRISTPATPAKEAEMSAQAVGEDSGASQGSSSMTDDDPWEGASL